MRKVAVLCICFLQSLMVLSAISTHEKQHGVADKLALQGTELGDHGKPRALFSRRGIMEYQRLRAMVDRLNSQTPKVGPVPALPRSPRCRKVMETCGPNSRCCSPCSSCHCRLFNSICYCWRVGRHCSKKA